MCIQAHIEPTGSSRVQGVFFWKTVSRLRIGTMTQFSASVSLTISGVTSYGIEPIASQSWHPTTLDRQYQVMCPKSQAISRKEYI